MSEKTIKPKNTESAADKKLAEYQLQMEEMKRQIEELTKSLGTKPNDPVKVDNKKFDLDDDIDVISLCNHRLNLYTGGFGQGERYWFDKFAEVKPIPFRDLKEIVKNNRSFLEKGYFYVDNEDARKAFRINRLYESLPNMQDFIHILEKTPQEVEKQLAIATAQQKDIIASVVIWKLFDGEKLDMNLVKVVGDAVHKDLVSIANDNKDLYAVGSD